MISCLHVWQTATTPTPRAHDLLLTRMTDCNNPNTKSSWSLAYKYDRLQQPQHQELMISCLQVWQTATTPTPRAHDLLLTRMTDCNNPNAIFTRNSFISKVLRFITVNVTLDITNQEHERQNCTSDEWTYWNHPTATHKKRARSEKLVRVRVYLCWSFEKFILEQDNKNTC